MRRHLLLPILGFLLIALAASAQNLLPGGDFEDGTMAPWGYHQEKDARATGGVETVAGATGSGALHISVAAAQQSNHVQVTCPFATSTLEDGEVYELTFRIRAVPPRPLSAHLIGNSRPWTNAGLREKVEADETWQRRRFLFRAVRPPQEKVKVDFFLGDQTGDVWFDDVALSKVVRPPAAADAGGPVLTNGHCEIAFTSDGAIARIRDTRSNRVLVGGMVQATAFNCELRNGEDTSDLSSSQAEKIELTTADGRLTCSYTYPDMTIDTTISPVPSTSLFRCGLAITNRGTAAITSVRYPVLHAPARLGEDSSDDVFLYPRCDGGIVEDPARRFGSGVLNDTYPGPLSCQLMAFYDQAAGLYIATHDPDGFPKRFTAKLKLDLTLDIGHLQPITPGGDVTLSYPVILGTFEGNWYDAADIYRAWAWKQPWCAGTLLQRDDTPTWVRKGGVVTCYSPRARTKDGKMRFDDDGLRAFCEQFTEEFGVPAIPNNRGWERYGEWCGQEYFPPFPDQPTFEQQARIIREAGGLGMIMLSGWRWTIDKPQPGGTIHSNQELFDREIRKHATCEADGVTVHVKTSEKTNDWHGTKYARLCPATAFAQNTVIETAKACVKAGYPIVHFDQEVSGPVAGSFCGSMAHGHQPGYGRWMHRAMADLYERVRAECTPLSPDFALSMEEPNELYLPWLNVCQSRPNGLTSEFPMKAPLTRVVPLFSFLYHEHLVGWIAFYPWRSQGHHAVTVAQGFAAGMMPGVHIESTYRWKPDVRKAFKTMVRNCSRLYVEEGMNALMFGRMLKPLALDIPGRDLKINKNGKTIRVPAVYHSVWRTADGKRCITLFNPEPVPHVVRIPQLPTPVTVPALDALLVALP